MGFLPNGDLFTVEKYRIYKYSIVNKTTNATLWEHSQIYDIETHKSLNRLNCFVYQTKLFLFKKGILTQWDLSTMTFEMQYNLISLVSKYDIYPVINKNQKLLALYQYYYDGNGKLDIYSMETGVHISRCGWYYFQDILLYNSFLSNLIVFYFYSQKIVFQ